MLKHIACTWALAYWPKLAAASTGIVEFLRCSEPGRDAICAAAGQSKYSRNSSPACNGCHDDHPFTVLTETKFSRLKTHQPGTDEKGVEEFILLCRERDASCNSICRQLHAEFSQRLLQVFSLHGPLDPECVNRVEDRRAIRSTLH